MSFERKEMNAVKMSVDVYGVKAVEMPLEGEEMKAVGE